MPVLPSWDITAELTALAEPREFGQDMREGEADRTVFTSVALRTSSGDEGVFVLRIGGTPVKRQFAMSQIQGGEREIPPGQQGIATNAGQEIRWICAATAPTTSCCC